MTASGQLKVTVWELRDFPFNLPISCEHRLAADYPEVFTGRTGVILPTRDGKAEFQTAFKHAYSGQQEIEFSIMNGDKDLAVATYSLDKVIKEGKDEILIKLNPQGLLDVRLHWVNPPPTYGENINISGLVVEESPLRSDYQKIFLVFELGETEIKHSSSIPANETKLRWTDSVDHRYSGESELAIFVCATTHSGEEVQVSCSRLDLWSILVDDRLPCVVAGLKLLDDTGNFAGRLGARLAFWDTPADKQKRPIHIGEPCALAEQETTTPAAQVADTQKPGHEYDPRQALEKARKAADDALENAQKAREAALQAASPNTPESLIANQGAEAAADIAEEHADNAASIIKRLEDNLPEDPRTTDAAVEDVVAACVAAGKAKEEAIKKAKEAAHYSARRHADDARKSALAAKKHSERLKELLNFNPEQLEELKPLENKGRKAAIDAQFVATHAFNKANEVEGSPKYVAAIQHIMPSSLQTAINATMAAAESANQAANDEREAEGSREKAEALVRKAEKREKKDRERIQKEMQEQPRIAEHETELERRRRERPRDLSESTIYREASVHPFSPGLQYVKTPVAREGSFKCCQPAVTSTADNRFSSPAVPFPVVEDEEFVETLMFQHKRSGCWCFGCGCLRCCGEC